MDDLPASPIENDKLGKLSDISITLNRIYGMLIVIALLVLVLLIR